tara:strand:+ start:1040 stop:1414 length:375 start_codon:yes stop_codon:yes gene_type:complete
MKLFEITSIETKNHRLDTKPYKWNIKGYYKGFDVNFVSEIKKISKETAIRYPSDEGNIIVKGNYPGEPGWYKIETTLNGIHPNIGSGQDCDIKYNFDELVFDYKSIYMPISVYIAFVGSVVTVL